MEACPVLAITHLVATSYAKLPHHHTVVPSVTFYIVAPVPIYVRECHENSTRDASAPRPALVV